MSSSGHVALVTPGFAHASRGGVERVAEWMYQQLTADGRFAPTIVSVPVSARPDSSALLVPSTWGRSPDTAKSVINDVNFTHVGTHFADVEFMRFQPHRRLTEVLREYDIIQVVAGTPAFGRVAADAKIPTFLQVATRVRSERVSGRPRVRGMRASYKRISTAIVSRLEERALQTADHVFVENVWMFDQVVAIRGDSEVSLTPPGVDTDWFQPGEASTGDGYILSVGRLSAQRKNFSGLIRAYARAVRDLKLGIPLVIAGAGDPSELRNFVESLGLARLVRIESEVSELRLRELYQGALAFVLASHEEGLGLVYLEALACGLPIIATATEGAKQIFSHGDVGIVVPLLPGGADLLVEALGQVGPITDHSRKDRRRVVLENFGNDVAIRRFTEVYERFR